MAIKARDYIAKLPEREQEAIEAEARQLIAEELSLAGIREARRQSQVALANRLGVQQPAVSKIERQTDLYLSTLREYIEAMGGKLELIARVPRSRARAHYRIQAAEATRLHPMIIQFPQDLESSLRAEVSSEHFASLDDAMAEAVRLLFRDRAPRQPAASPDADLRSIGAMRDVPTNWMRSSPTLTAKGKNLGGSSPLNKGLLDTDV